ncbi:uncharacterized protein LOC122320471 [Drosophila ficusphila]|uniref:uncharacterized protein LOC122320471 n=1 Tax=Drosophila ficusphila TaxID=30025 RepID=UPI001C89C956|nr:uncharacterized protein LOC122320471 [Drosophila ficusphila]
MSSTEVKLSRLLILAQKFNNFYLTVMISSFDEKRLPRTHFLSSGNKRMSLWPNLVNTVNAPIILYFDYDFMAVLHVGRL